MTRFQRSWTLAKASWAVLKSERQLAWLPVFSFIASLVVAGIFAVLVWATLGKETGLDGQETTTANVATYLLAACAYLGTAFVQTYFLAALCVGANERLRGFDTTLGRSFAVANTRLHRILSWAFVSATVSVIIRAIEERFGIVGRLIGGLLGAGWNVLTFLTVPIIVFEDAGPVTALKRSGTLLKETWGENVIAQLGFGVISLVAMLPAIVLAVACIATGVSAVIVVGIAVAVAWVLVVATIMAALGGIYRTALYRYAADGTPPAAFAGFDLEHAFGQRKGGGSGSSGLGGFGGGFVK
jgi:hypothetical protein